MIAPRRQIHPKHMKEGESRVPEDDYWTDDELVVFVNLIWPTSIS